MKSGVLILRPEPGAGETAARARALGLEPVVAPLFDLRALAWQPPSAAEFDAVLLTSANAARLGGTGLKAFRGLPCYAVGGRTAGAARAAGFANIRTGGGDAADLLEMMASDGVRRAFHPCGREHVPVAHAALRIERIPVYAADAAERLRPEAEAAVRAGAIALIHSPRAASVLADLVGTLRADIRIAAISAAAAAAAGEGWREVAVAAVPRDEALLELAAKLCQSGRR